MDTTVNYVCWNQFQRFEESLIKEQKKDSKDSVIEGWGTNGWGGGLWSMVFHNISPSKQKLVNKTLTGYELDVSSYQSVLNR